MDELIKLLNDNQGVVTVIIFILTIFIGWLSGLFSYIKNKPNLKLSRYSPIIPYFFINDGLKLNKNEENGLNVERVVFFLGLSISNIGFSNTTIESYRLEYKDISGKNHKLLPMSLPEPLSHGIGDYKKIFPSLTTNYPHLGFNNSWKIDVGSSIQGFLYFNIEYYGDYKPLINNDIINSKLYINDVYGKTYKFKVNIIKKDVDYLSTFINQDILLNHNSYEESVM